MNDLSDRPGKAAAAAPGAPEGKLIQIGGRQFRRHHARALKIQQANAQPVQLAPEAPVPQAYVPPAPPQPLPKVESQLRPRQARRRNYLPALLGFLGLAVLPALIGIFYFGYYATDQYVAEAQFAIRSQSQPGDSSGSATSLLGSPLANLGETVIVSEYLHSDQVLRDIEDDVDIRALFSVEKADWWARLDPTVSREKLLSYWKWMCTVALDPTTGIVTLTVRAFSPEDAKRISEAALAEGEKVVNELSERARKDRLAIAEAEVANSKGRVNNAVDALQKFQAAHGVPDTTVIGTSAQGRLEKLKADLSDLQTQLASMSKTMAATSPRITVLKQNIAAVEDQLKAETAKAGSSANGSEDVTVLTSEAGKLALEVEFAKNAYTSALKSLEMARIEAGRQVKYLEAFVRPRLPEASLYPDRPIMIGMSIGLSIFFWLLTLLVIATVKEHL